jgi:hypothetical protein
MNDDNIYLTYIYMDPRQPGNFNYQGISLTFEPFYVGKGPIERVEFHIYEAAVTKGYSPSHKVNKIRGLLNQDLKPVIIVLQSGLSERDAFALEKLAIKKIGRKDLGRGPLLNLTDGGEGSSGRVVSKETKAKIGDRHYPTGKDHHNYGTKLSEEHKAKFSRLGYKHTEETKRKLSEACIFADLTDEELARRGK